ncbi:MAG: hypothetical protein O7G84_01050 [Gammaproteobacteria bacterium]|nr:hypothetical protein [Gammaproteobacteria bacterium]
MEIGSEEWVRSQNRAQGLFLLLVFLAGLAVLFTMRSIVDMNDLIVEQRQRLSDCDCMEGTP